MHRLAPELLEQLFPEVLQDGRCLTLAAGGADDEVIGDQRNAADIEQDNVAGLLVRSQVDDASREVKRFGAILRRGRFAGYV
jgi:hypothetical protein